MTEIRFVIAEDFSRYPGGRFRKDGRHSGEALRDALLPLLKNASRDSSQITVLLDGTVGYSASFLEEAFGGLVREGTFSKSDLVRILTIRAEHPVFAPYKALADRYIAEAQTVVAA